MKRILLRLGAALIILIVLLILAINLFLDGAVKRGIETIGSRLTQVPVRLDSVSLSLLSGSGTVKGLVVGNPEPFKTPQAIQMGSASLVLRPGSILSDKVVITSVKVESPEITFEGGLGGNNLSKILANVRSNGGETNATATQTNAAPAKAGKKLEVDDFLITGAKVNASVTGMGGRYVQVPLPEIHLTDLGKGPDGITSAELTEIVLSAIEKESVKAASTGIAGLGKGTSALTQDLGNGTNGVVGGVQKGLGELLKKK